MDINELTVGTKCWGLIRGSSPVQVPALVVEEARGEFLKYVKCLTPYGIQKFDQFSIFLTAEESMKALVKTKKELAHGK